MSCKMLQHCSKMVSGKKKKQKLEILTPSKAQHPFNFSVSRVREVASCSVDCLLALGHLSLSSLLVFVSQMHTLAQF